MKKVLMLLVAVVAIMVCIVGCSTQDYIIGTWRLESYYEGDTKIDYEGNIKFEEDGSCTMNVSLQGREELYTLSWEKQNEGRYILRGDDFPNNLECIIEDNILMISMEDYKMTCIKE